MIEEIQAVEGPTVIDSIVVVGMLTHCAFCPVGWDCRIH